MTNKPVSIDCLKMNQELFLKLDSAKAFDDPLETLRFALSRSTNKGIALEFGVYSGRTLKIIAECHPNRTFGFDTFEGLPEDWREGFPSGTFSVENVPEIQGAVCIKGWFQDSLKGFLVQMRDDGF